MLSVAIKLENERDILYGTIVELAFLNGTISFLTSFHGTLVVINDDSLYTSLNSNVRQMLFTINILK